MLNRNTELDLHITTDTIQGWLDELGSLTAQIEILTNQVKGVEDRLRAAAILLGHPPDHFLRKGSAYEEEEQETMPDAIVRVVNGAGGKMLSRTEIRMELRKDPVFAKRLEQTPNNFYNALKRLDAKHRIRKVGDRFAPFPKEQGAD